MGDTFESLNPGSYYEGELAKLSGELMKSDHIIKKLKEYFLNTKNL